MEKVGFIFERQVLQDIIENNITRGDTPSGNVDIVDAKARVRVICSGE
jgi:hypothetical protein